MGQVIKKENIVIVTGEYQGQNGMKKEYRTIGEIVTYKNDNGQISQFGKLWGAGGATEFNIYAQRDRQQVQAPAQTNMGQAPQGGHANVQMHPSHPAAQHQTNPGQPAPPPQPPQQFDNFDDDIPF